MGIPKFKINQPLKKDLSQLELTEADLVSGDFPAEEIFQLKMDDNILGFFWQYDLKDYVQQDTSFEENTYIQKYGESAWMNLFDHPFFQRRKPQVVNKIDSSSHAQEYFILDQGQKIGPFSIEEIQEQVRTKKAILTDMISLDDGHTWGKIYNLIAFDRRNETQAFLPHSPEKEVLSHSTPEVKSKISNKGSDATEFIAGLAYIGKNLSPMADQEQPSDIEENNRKSKLKLAWVSVAVIAFIGIFAYMLNSDGSKNTKITGNKKVQRDIKNKARVLNIKKAKAAKKTISNNAKAANARKAQQRAAARRNKIRNSTPFKRSKTYRKAANARSKRFVEVNPSDDPYVDDSYDNADEPVEQDPVRRTLSKDTINPDEDYDNAAIEEEEQYNEEEKDIVDEESDNEAIY